MEFFLLIAAAGAPASSGRNLAEMHKFLRELEASGRLRAAIGPLRPASESARVRVRDGQAAVANGAAGGESLLGCFAIDVADRAAALAVAERCPVPAEEIVEVRAGRYLPGRAPSGAKRFLLLYLLERGAPVPDPERIKQGMAEMRAFTDALAREGKYLGDGALPPQLPAARVVTRSGRLELVDGPFAESKEVLAGFAYVEAASREEAIATAKRVPHAAWGEVLVREVAAPPAARE